VTGAVTEEEAGEVTRETAEEEGEVTSTVEDAGEVTGVMTVEEGVVDAEADEVPAPELTGGVTRTGFLSFELLNQSSILFTNSFVFASCFE
jgi:hypothetical protein